jgi:hypothetical protein
LLILCPGLTAALSNVPEGEFKSPVISSVYSMSREAFIHLSLLMACISITIISDPLAQTSLWHLQLSVSHQGNVFMSNTNASHTRQSSTIFVVEYAY